MAKPESQNKDNVTGLGEKLAEKSSPNEIGGLEQSVDLRQVQSEDIEEMMSIERASFTSPWSARFFLEEIRVSYARSVLAEVQGRIVGYIIYWQLPNEADIHNLAVHPTYRRRGIGRSLLRAAIASANKSHSHRVTLEVRKSNQAAQQLYQSLGFVERGVRKGYYSDDGEDALVMVLDLEP